MKLKIRNSTVEELRQELDRNLIDLLGDVLLLNCVLRCSEQNMPVSCCYTQETVDTCLSRLTGYIDQHAEDAMMVSRQLRNIQH